VTPCECDPGAPARFLAVAPDRADNGNAADKSASDKSVAFRNLATAAGGVNKIAAYCAKVPHPGASEAGRSSTHPSGKPSTHPGGKPTPLPSHGGSSSGALR